MDNQTYHCFPLNKFKNNDAQNNAVQQIVSNGPGLINNGYNFENYWNAGRSYQIPQQNNGRNYLIPQQNAATPALNNAGKNTLFVIILHPYPVDLNLPKKK